MTVKKPLLFFFLISAIAGHIGTAEAMKAQLRALQEERHDKLVQQIVTQKAPSLTTADPQIEQALKQHDLPTAFQQAENAYKKVAQDRDNALDTVYLMGKLVGGGTDPLDTTLQNIQKNLGGPQATLLDNVNALQANFFTRLIKRVEYFEAVAKATDGDDVNGTKVTQNSIDDAKKRFPQFVEVMRGSYYHSGVKYKMATTSKQSSEILAGLKTAGPLPLDQLLEIALKFMAL